MSGKIQLIVGLGNPGQQYEATRHNVGAWFVELIANEHNIQFQSETKFHGKVARVQSGTQDFWLLLPTTYMNKSGLAVRMMSQFYKIPADSILIAHDELDFSPGVVRFKQEGGHGGHNGIRDVIEQLQTKHFHRLRIGIGHPGHRDDVTDYVLNRPSKQDHKLIMASLESAKSVLPTFLSGDFQKAIAELHNK